MNNSLNLVISEDNDFNIIMNIFIDSIMVEVNVDNGRFMMELGKYLRVGFFLDVKIIINLSGFEVYVVVY